MGNEEKEKKKLRGRSRYVSWQGVNGEGEVVENVNGQTYQRMGKGDKLELSGAKLSGGMTI
jgi:hypothetical protein